MSTRQYEQFKELPQELYNLGLDIGGNRVLAYFNADYNGPTMVIAGSRLLAAMPNVEEGLKLARYALSPESGTKEVEIIPAETIQETEHQSFEDWLQANSHA